MGTNQLNTLPKLPYEYPVLTPNISEEQLKLHNLKNHQEYVTGARSIFEKLDRARKDNADLDFKRPSRNCSSTEEVTGSITGSGKILHPREKVAEEH